MKEKQYEPIDRPQLTIRIPGPWREVAELRAALPFGYAIEDDRLHLPDGSSVTFCVWPRDREFASIFEGACRGPLSSRCRRAVQGYAMNAGVSGPGGSTDAARRVLKAAAAIVRGGGAGVLIDNSCLAHEGRDVLEMAESRDVEALIVAYVNCVGRSGGGSSGGLPGETSGGQDELWSLGMHAFGLHDAVMSRTGDDTEDQGTMFQFLCVVCRSEDAIETGDLIETEDYVLRVSGETAGRFHVRSPAHNPYGHWHLDRSNGVARHAGGR